ncbi:MAG: HlyD family secretion protein [Leptospiraceae bacterium]|nr:HlyD family secretion protein [Leptospiraceae bacterium]
MKLKIFFITLMVVNQCSGKKESKEIQIADVHDLVYSVATIKPERELSFRMGIYCYLSSVYVKEGDLVKKNQKLFSCEGLTQNSPFAGQILSVSYKVGENVLPGSPILTVSDTKSYYLEAVLDQHSAYKVRAGQNAYVSIEGNDLGQIESKVEKIYSKNERYIARLSLSKFPEGALGGMTTDVIIEVGKREKSPVFPIRLAQNGKGYICQKNGKGSKLEVKLNPIDSEKAEIISAPHDIGQYEVCL